jgi:NTE family protein
LRKLISDNLSLSDLSETRIPLHVLLADAHFGGESWFDKGPIVDILYGSAAIPGVLPPLRLGGRRYIDGGMVNPNPVQHAVKLGANRIVLLLCGSLTPSFHSKGRPLATLLMGYELTQLSLTKVELANLPESASVVVLECGAADSIDALDFRHSNLLITAGQRSAARAGERLSQLLH